MTGRRNNFVLEIFKSTEERINIGVLWDSTFMIQISGVFFCLSFFFNKFICFIYFWLHWVFLAMCGLFSSCREQGLLFVAVHRLLIVVAWALGARASVVVARGL